MRMVTIEDYDIFLNHLEDTWNLSQKCKELTLRNKFNSNDIRNTFFIQVSNILNDYYNGLLSPFLIIRLKDVFKIPETQRCFPDLKENKLISNLGFLTDLNYLKTWHDKQKLNLVFSLWIVFEDTIDVFYKNISKPEEVEVYKNLTFNKIKRFLIDKVSEDELNIIKEKLFSEYIGVTNKYNLLLSKVNSDEIDKKTIREIREFLDFFNTLRNTLHLNSRPIKDRMFNVPFGKYSFTKDKHIDFFTFDVLFKSTEYLVDRFDLIRKNIKYESQINSLINI